MKEKAPYRLASALIVLIVLLSQLGMNFLHTHHGQAPETAITVAAQPDNGSSPCQACSMDGTPVMYTEAFQLAPVTFTLPAFVESFPADVRLPLASSSQGRAPPIA